MQSPSILGSPRSTNTFSHEALFYSGPDDFTDRICAFIRDSIRHDEAILVVVSEAKIAAIRSELGADDPRLRFADMRAVGLNPARIIPAWREFVTEHAHSGHRFRGIGEPIWAERTAQELVELRATRGAAQPGLRRRPGLVAGVSI